MRMEDQRGLVVIGVIDRAVCGLIILANMNFMKQRQSSTFFGGGDSPKRSPVLRVSHPNLADTHNIALASVSAGKQTYSVISEKFNF